MSLAVARPTALASVAPCPPAPEWVLPDHLNVPESNPHRDTTELLRQILLAWLARTQRPGWVVSNLAVRWDQDHPAVGLDPDVALLDPPPPEGEDVGSLLAWKPGHHVPPLAIEVVSPTNATKDYATAPLKYASLGVTELWIVDPEGVGPAAHGGPHALQVWVRSSGGGLDLVEAGEGPFYSPYLDAWLVLKAKGRRQQLRISGDARGTRLWLTEAEQERAAKEQERRAKQAALLAKETERIAKEQALARIAELEAQLAQQVRKL